MLKPQVRVFAYVWLIFGCVFAVSANYDRNTAQPVQKVEYGTIESVRNITESQLVEDRNQGWKTFGGALIGGVIGHQFGGGSGQDVATVLGALLGAGIGHRSGQSYYQQMELVELMIRYEDDERVMVIQDKDPGMIFNAGDEVRVVYLASGVRVDMAM
ncbi:glycine zipper 2TM domain-containing protein [Shewanella waksmanii]|uniref:glycine zipper 2TM domain-containing protein n=1 Tax=Shewanella waksmanii TaxID=213783 RepID=UPI0037354016